MSDRPPISAELHVDNDSADLLPAAGFRRIATMRSLRCHSVVCSQLVDMGRTLSFARR